MTIIRESAPPVTIFLRWPTASPCERPKILQPISQMLCRMNLPDSSQICFCKARVLRYVRAAILSAMPITLPPVSRRRFISQSLAAACGGLLWENAASSSADTPESEMWVLFSDTHIAADRAELSRGVTMSANLEQCIKEALALQSKPVGLILSGDCAYQNGLEPDYETFAAITKPLREWAPVHLMMGNHDNRGTFGKVLGKDQTMPSPVEQRIAGLVKTPLANWFLLDSLIETNHTPGEVGHAQLEWLSKELDAHADKPAIVVVHHNVVLEPSPTGLQDSPQLLEVLRPRKHVKACIFGHTHVWEAKQDESGLHLINLPPTAYVFKAGLPSGWVVANVSAKGLKLELNAIDKTHPQHGDKKDLAWRV